ncbi:MAG: sugar phosphate isomerase/epimerase [Planctomycetes bacterium]|nr:sugar phosphate isomerase/epimerase [Planctomycetota bacterium]
MKTCGHTMGTPDRDIFQAIQLFALIGYDGIEVRCAPDGQIDPLSISPDEIRRIIDCALECGIDFACLTPYAKNYVDPAERKKTLAEMRKTIEVAEALGCARVRSYGGIEADGAWGPSVEGVRETGRIAAGHGVTICVENHAGTLTMSAADTVRFVEDVGLDNVGILYDHAWVRVAGQETIEEAIDMQMPYLRHAHVKDWKFVDGEVSNREACLLGEGDIDWPTVLRMLRVKGYDGYLSDEYEKKWHPDKLPDAAIGMKKNREYVLRHIS